MLTKKVILIGFAMLFFMGLYLLSAIGIVPQSVFFYYMIASMFTFLIYVRDKQAAKKTRWRTPEKTLHFLSLLGGWPGAILGQQILRHKSSKKSFQTLFWITLALNTVFSFCLISYYSSSMFPGIAKVAFP